MREHYVYKIAFESGEFYIGVRTSPIGLTAEQDTSYVGSPGKLNAWRWQKFGYIKQIIAKRATRKEANWLEHRLILLARKLYGTKCINMHSNKGWCRYGISPTKLERQAISRAMKGRIFTESHKARLSGMNNHFYGKTHTEATKQKLSRLHKGKQISEEQRAKISDTLKGRRPGNAKVLTEERLFVHKDGRSYLAPIGSTTGDIAKTIGARYNKVWELLKGNIKHTKGWSLSA